MKRNKHGLSYNQETQRFETTTPTRGFKIIQWIIGGAIIWLGIIIMVGNPHVQWDWNLFGGLALISFGCGVLDG